MCEVESQVTTGHNGITSSEEKLNVSCPEGITSDKTLSLETPEGHEGGEKTDPVDSSSGDLEVRRASVGTKEPLGVAPRETQNSIVDGTSDVEGVDPFKEKSVVDGKEPIANDGLLKVSLEAPKERRGSKTVSFKEPESEEEEEEEYRGKKGDTNENGTTNELMGSGNSTSSNGSNQENGAVERKPNNKQRSLGDANPVYRLSMKLSPNLFNIQEIPGANQHREAEKVGYLTKLSGRSFPYIPQWKRRYCVLSKGRLYYYEREDSKPGEKSNGVINLEYFDQVTEAAPKECKKATNVFIITSQDRSFFDPGRHLFSADTLPDMKDWVRKLQAALEQIRNNNRSATSTTSSKKDSGKKGKGESVENKENKENAQNLTKDRKKKKQDSHRPRKSARVGDGPETPSQGHEVTSAVTSHREAAELPTMTSAVGIQLPGMTSPRGVQLPGMSSRKESQSDEPKELTKEANQQTEDGLPVSGPTLTCVTKQRVRGPQGRRAPQNRRTMAANNLKKRASSLSALEYQELNDNSEAPWLNRSLDMLDDANPTRNGGLASAGCAPPLPYKAYNYSTDEEEMDDDGEHSQSDSFPTSAAAMPPPPPPRSASYGLDYHRNPSLGQVGRQVLHRSLGDAQGSAGDLRGSKHSLGDGRMYGLVGEWRGSSGEQWVGSHSSLGQNGEIMGSASPVMDDLDNLLMNQSIQQTSGALDSASESGSEGSTCRPAGRQQQQQQQQLQHKQQQQKQLQMNHQPAKRHSKHHKKSGGPDLSRFSVAVKHLQRHVVEIDRAVFSITGDVAGTRQEVTALKEAVVALQTDTDTITTTLSHLTEEAISAQQKITFASQEAEKIRKIANVALKEAEQAKQEQLKSKKEYEHLLEEMKSTMKVLKESQKSESDGPRKSTVSNITSKGPIPAVVSSQDNPALKTPATKPTEEPKGLQGSFKPSEECLKTSSPKSNRISSSSVTSSSSSSRLSGGSSVASAGAVLDPPPVSKSSSFTQGGNTPKVPAYQSLFARPSSLISGLTNRSYLSKSVSFADQKNEEKGQVNTAETQNENSEKKREEKQMTTLERKDKNEKHTTSLERKGKNEKQMTSLERKDKNEKQITTLERKDKKDPKHNHKEDKKATIFDTNSKERKSKDKKDYGSIDRKERKHRHASKEKRNHLKDSKEEEHMISNLSLEDIPMADDNSGELLDRVALQDKTAAPIKPPGLSLGTQTPTNFSLGKSSSTPAVSPTGLGSRPRVLPLSRERQSDLCNSNASTPESSTASPFPQPYGPFPRPSSPYSRSSSALPPVEENCCVSPSSSLTSLHRPGSTPGPLSRQGSMTTVPEDRAVIGPPRSRPGVFAISRQNSSPNIPLQRQNSGPSIPLQRQHSLGVVPEEGRLPRQESLMSVPENRRLVDQTLPLSPSHSMTYFPISPSSSTSTVSESVRRAARASMELVTGPILAGSAMQEASATGTLAVLASPDEDAKPTATSTLKKDHKPQKDVDGVAV